jgi:hypothetical protein
VATASPDNHYENRSNEGNPRGRFRIRTRGYFYEIATADERQILSFHWQPEAKPTREGDKVVTEPHMHVGQRSPQNKPLYIHLIFTRFTSLQVAFRSKL